MKPQGLVLRKPNPKVTYGVIPFIERSRNHTIIEMEKRLVAAPGRGRVGGNGFACDRAALRSLRIELCESPRCHCGHLAERLHVISLASSPRQLGQLGQGERSLFASLVACDSQQPQESTSHHGALHRGVASCPEREGTEGVLVITGSTESALCGDILGTQVSVLPMAPPA